MDSVLKLTILLLESIDTGTEGIDDVLAAELRKTYEKYLGKFLSLDKLALAADFKVLQSCSYPRLVKPSF
jgi:hypothetical protein